MRKPNWKITKTRQLARQANKQQFPYGQIIEKLDMSPRRAAKFLGLNERTSRRYATGDFPVNRPIALLLAVMNAKHLKPEQVESLLAQ